MDILKKLERVGTDGGKPACPVKIVDCGESSESNTYSAVRTEKGALVYFGMLSGTSFVIFFRYLCILISLQKRKGKYQGKMLLRMIVLMDEGEKDLRDLRGREEKRERGDTLHLTHIAQRTILLILPIVTLTHILHRQTQHQVMKSEGGNRKETGIGEEKERGTIEERSNEDGKIKDQGTSQNGVWFDCLCGAFYFVVFYY